MIGWEEFLMVLSRPSRSPPPYSPARNRPQNKPPAPSTPSRPPPEKYSGLSCFTCPIRGASSHHHIAACRDNCRLSSSCPQRRQNRADDGLIARHEVRGHGYDGRVSG